MPDTKFGPNEYSDDDREYSDVDDRDRGSLTQPNDQQNTKDNLNLKANSQPLNKEEPTKDILNKSKYHSSFVY